MDGGVDGSGDTFSLGHALWMERPQVMFEKSHGFLCQVIQQTGDLTLLTDGERRYGSLLFELCSQALRNGKRGRPKKTLPKGVKVRLKNKGSQGISEGFCRKFCSGGREGAVAPVCGGIRRPGSRTVRPQ